MAKKLKNLKDGVSGSGAGRGFPIDERKFDHVRISLEKCVTSRYNFWDDILLEHNPLPEVDFDEISLETRVFGRGISAPVVISGMTGGHPRLTKINRNLAMAAAEMRLPMGVGSQRPALEHPELVRSYSVIKEFDIPLRIANIGAPQLVSQRKNQQPLTIDDCKKLMDMIDAHILAIHLNYLQEDVQIEGEKNAAGVIERIREISSELPVMVKETGAGVSYSAARSLVSSTKIIGIDVGGLSGTSFSAVEYFRAVEHNHHLSARVGKMLWDWGIPTPISILNASSAGIREVIATGGIRSGLDIARALTLGARCAGVARGLLPYAVESAKDVRNELESLCHELKVVMHLTGSQRVDDLKKVNVFILGKTGEIINSRHTERSGSPRE